MKAVFFNAFFMINKLLMTLNIQCSWRSLTAILLGSNAAHVCMVVLATLTVG